MERLDCRIFEDQLDALVRRELSDEGVAHLRGHAAGCRECGALLRMKEHLLSPSLEELEERVPDALVASMWEGVRGALKGRRRSVGARFGWLTPALAAAAVILLLMNGLALRSLRQAEDRAHLLTKQVLDQQRRLVSLEEQRATPPGDAPGLMARRMPMGALEGQAELTVAYLRTLLARLPARRPVITAEQSRILAFSSLVPTPWRNALDELEAGRDVTPRDLLRVLDGLDLPGDALVPTGRLFELLS